MGGRSLENRLMYLCGLRLLTGDGAASSHTTKQGGPVSSQPSERERTLAAWFVLPHILADWAQGFLVRGHDSFLGRQVALAVCPSFWLYAKESA